MLVTIAGKRWKLQYDRLPAGVDGTCDPPTAPGKRIVLRRGLRRRPRLLMETLLHEALHASGWQLSEEAVDQVAADLERLLWSQGFRLEKG